MKLFEYMGKDIFKEFRIPVPSGRVVSSAEEAATVAREIGSVVLKSQVLSGKRGKAGGIKFADTPEEARAAASDLLGLTLGGSTVDKLLVEQKLKIDREFYLAVTLDGGSRSPIVLASADGGMDIEEVPEERIVRRVVDVNLGILPYLGREVASRLGLKGKLVQQFSSLLVSLYRAFEELDGELVEINPLVVSGENLIAADAKVTVDDEALFRHPELPEVSERTTAEERARELGLSYVELDGDIAIMANGAGITMATLDIIQHFGGRPANFLDAGGGASVESTARAIEILLTTKPKVIFINIFGGITRCDDVANAFVQVKEKQGIPVPVVIRMVGTNEDVGVQLLKKNGIEAYRTMFDAARKVVELANS